MTESLKCPECSAPLEHPADGAKSLTCPYCNSSVLLDRPAGDSPLPSDVEARLIERLSAGDRIAAIKLYREHCNVDLRTAKQIIDRLAASRFPGTVVIQNSRGSRVGWWVAGTLIFIFVGFPMLMGLLGMLVFGLHSSSTQSTSTVTRNYTPPTMPAMPATPELPDFAKPRPAAPAFATLLSKFGSEGIGAGQFKDARAIALDGAGHVYVAESSGGRVQVFDASGTFLKAWVVDPKQTITGLTANREGNVLAVAGFKLLCFEGLSGRAFGEAQSTNEEGQPIYWNDATFTLTGEIYALDNVGNIRILNGTGQIQRTIPAKQLCGDDEAKFDKIAVSGDGQIYLLDSHRGIYHFTPDGKYRNSFATIEEDDPTARNPQVLRMAMYFTVDGQGRIIVGDLMPAIKIFDHTGRFLGSIADNDLCFGVAVNDANEIYGCFRNDHEVRKYALVKK